MLPGANETLRRLRSTTFSSAMRPNRIQFSMRFKVLRPGQSVPGSDSTLGFPRFKRYLFFMAVPATAKRKRPPASPRLPKTLTEES